LEITKLEKTTIYVLDLFLVKIEIKYGLLIFLI